MKIISLSKKIKLKKNKWVRLLTTRTTVKDKTKLVTKAFSDDRFKKELSIIIPAYNEEGTIESVIKRTHNSLLKKGFKFEILVINDRSTDNTASLVKKIGNKYKAKIYNKKGKQGKAYSLTEGFVLARYRNIGFIDADLQYPPEALAHMSLKLNKSDIVVSNRKKYGDSILRRFLSRSFRFFFGKILFRLNYDIQSGLKVFRRDALNVVPFTPVSAWAFDLEFLHNAREAGYKIANHDITFLKRKKGQSKIGLIKTIIEIGTAALRLRFSSSTPRYIAPTTKTKMKGAGLRFKGQKYITHTTLDWKKSSIRTFTVDQKFLIFSTLLLLVFGLYLNTVTTIMITLALLSFVYFGDTLFNLFIVLKSLHAPQEIAINKKEIDNLDEKNLPVYTILCPLYKESHIIPQFVKNISRLSWPHDKLDVILLLEEDDKESIRSARKMKLPSFVRIVVVPHSQPKTKPKACNYGLSFAKGAYVVIFDAEDKPEIEQLKKAFIAFQKVGKKVLCLQAKLNYYNPHQNLLTRFFTQEYSLWFDVTLTGLQSINTSIPLGGTSNHFRTNDLLLLKGWDPFNVTEDADLGMRLFKEGYKTAIIDSVTLEEANSRWGNWIRQRSRWIKGYMQTYLVHTRDSLNFIKNHGSHFPIFHLIIGGKIAFILINPILWVATASYFVLNQYVGDFIESVYPAAIFYIASVSLVFGNFLFMYYYMIGVMKREQNALLKFTFLVPFYWLMISVAGYVALYQLIFKPFYWEKTVHGLHLLQKTKTQKKLPATLFPKPVIGYPPFVRVAAQPAFFMNKVQKRVFKNITIFLVAIGEIEKKTLDLSVKGFKKGILMPLKYASSILS